MKRRIRRINVGLTDRVTTDATEAPFPIGSTQFGHKGVTIRIKTTNIQGGNLTHGEISLLNATFEAQRKRFADRLRLLRVRRPTMNSGQNPAVLVHRLQP